MDHLVDFDAKKAQSESIDTNNNKTTVIIEPVKPGIAEPAKPQVIEPAKP